MWSFRQTKHFPKILDLVKHVIEEYKDLDGFAMIIWTFWFQRNRLRIENRPFPIIDVISMANNILAEFIKAILVQPMTPLSCLVILYVGLIWLFILSK